VKVDKSKYDNSWYKPGSAFKRISWYYADRLLFRNSLLPFSSFKASLLRLYGAKIGKACIIKPDVIVKYPWFLEVGNYVWIGERVWIDNLAKVTIDEGATISQGALLLTGNHNYKSEQFDLMVSEIYIEEGAWVGAKAIVGPGVRIGKNSMLTLGSRTSKSLDAGGIYDGIPAQRVKERFS